METAFNAAESGRPCDEMQGRYQFAVLAPYKQAIWTAGLLLFDTGPEETCWLSSPCVAPWGSMNVKKKKNTVLRKRGIGAV